MTLKNHLKRNKGSDNVSEIREWAMFFAAFSIAIIGLAFLMQPPNTTGSAFLDAIVGLGCITGAAGVAHLGLVK